MQNPAKSLAILLLVIVAVALVLAACNNSSDDGRITALEEGLSRAEAQERKSREATADEREEIAERLSALEQALERAEAERNTNEEMNAETRSLVMSVLTGMPGGSGVGGMRPTDEQMLQEVGMERERLLQKVPRFVMEGASPDQKTVIEAGTDCLASRDQGMPEQLQELNLENYRLNAERTDNDAELVMMTYMTCSTARIEPGEIGTPSAERADATAMLVACYAEHEGIAGDQPSVEMVEQTLSIFDDDGAATSIARLICQGLSQEAMQQKVPDPLIVGHLNALTGSLSYFGESHSNSIGLAADHINRAGGIQGGSVILVHRDTAVNPVQGVSAAEELVNVQGVVAIVGALASGVTIPVATSVTVPNGVLQVSGASTAPAITVLEDNDFLFRTSLSDASQGVVLADLAKELGYESAGILYINNAYGEGLAAQFTESFTALGGTVIASVPHEDSQPTFVSELEKATEGDPDVLIAISYQQAEVYLREALEGGYADTFLFVDGTKIPESFAVIGWDLLEGSYGTGPGFEANPSTQAFIDSYLRTYDMEPEHPFMNETYDAMILIGLAAAKAGTTTDSAAIRDALRDVANPPGEVVRPGEEGIKRAMELIADGKDINYEGAAGSVDLDENGDVITGHIEVWKIEGGEIVSDRQVPVDLGQ